MSDIDTTLLRALVNLVGEIKDRLGQVDGAQSSVEIATSARGYDVKVKAYVGSNVRAAGDAALEEYARVMRELSERQMSGWATTVEALKR